MYTASSAFLPALRGAHTAYGYLEAWYGGARLTVTDDRGAATTRLPLEVAGQNEVPVDGATPGARRTLTATLTPIPGLWDALEPVGTELRAFTVLRHPSGVEETIPQGVFPVDAQQITYGPAGTLSIAGPDRWKLIQDARFLTPRAATVGITVRQHIANLLLEVLPPGTTVIDVATSTATVPAQTWDRDRDKAIQDLAAAGGIDVSFDRNGAPVIRDVPVLTPSSPVWTVDAGPGGVMTAADRRRDRQKTFNLVVVNAQTTDGSTPLPPQYVWDNDPTSPTFCGPGLGYGTTPPDPSQAGPFGQRPTFYSSPLLTTAAQAVAAGQAILARVLGRAAQLTLGSIPNAALDDGDTIAVKLPPARRDLPWTREVHLVEGFTVPLIPSRSTMPITTRSTRPDDVATA